MVGIMRAFKPHLILHSGDLFESPRPLVEDMRLAQDALGRMAELAPTLVISGNHDSAALLDLFDKLVSVAGSGSRLRFIGQPRLGKDGILTYAGEAGETARVATLPFVHAHRLIESLETPTLQRTLTYADRLTKLQANIATQLKKDYQSKRHILLYVAHLYVEGAITSYSERPLHVSETYATKVSSIPLVSYAAFGHIHKPQALPGTVPGRYAGSPIALDFGEAKEQKEMVLIEAKPGQAAKIETVPLKGGRRLRVLRGDRQQLMSLSQLSPERGGVDRDILRVTVELEKPQAGLADWVSQLFPKAVLVDVVESITGLQEQELAIPRELESEELSELFASYLQENPHPQWGAAVLLQRFEEMWRYRQHLMEMGELTCDRSS